MSIFGDDTDTDFSIGPSGGSRLGALFGGQPMTDGNEDFKYTAPKEPNKNKPEGEKKTAGSSVIHATAVHTYKLVDGSFQSQGKVGSAIVGSHDLKQYKLLLYRTNKQPVTDVNISAHFKLTVQPSNYANFYDDKQQNWSITFDTEEALIQFAKHVAICKANVMGPALDHVIQQDLILGEGWSLENGDSVEVKYTGWLLQNSGFGKVFDSNEGADKFFRFKLGKGKVIKGWDSGVIGMKKGSRRILVIPPSMAYADKGMGDKVPANSTLIFDLTVMRVKVLRERESTPPDDSAWADTPRAGTPESTTGEETVKARSRSITEQMSQQGTKTEKAQLLSRMAKMGQPMLPVNVNTMTDTNVHNDVSSPLDGLKPSLPNKPTYLASQSHSQPPVNLQNHTAPQPVPQPAVPQSQQFGYQQPQMAQPAMMQTTVQQTTPYNEAMVMQGVQMPAHSQLAVFQPQQGMPGQVYQLQQAHPQKAASPVYQAPTAPSSSGTDLVPVLLTETRQQNTEVRMAISKVTDRIDKLSDKLDQAQSFRESALNSTAPLMETGVLLQNLTRIVQENDRLKKDVYEKSAKIESQNEKIATLLQQNQKYVEQSHSLLEERHDTIKSSAAQAQAKLLSLEQDKVQLATDLTNATAQISTLQLEVNRLKKNEFERKAELDEMLNKAKNQKENLDNIKETAEESSNRVEALTASLKEEKQTRRHFEMKFNSVEEELAELKQTKKTLEKTLVDSKNKLSAEKSRLEEDLDDLKRQHENEIENLKSKIRKMKSSTDAATEAQVSEIENELNEQWQKKCDRLVAASNDKHQRVLQQINEEKELLQDKARDLEMKLSSIKTGMSDSQKQHEDLQEQLEEAKPWKEKYERLRGQATDMKKRYEDRISELEIERNDATSERDEAMSEKYTAVSERDRAVAERERAVKLAKETLAKSASSSDSTTEQVPSVDLAGEVKKIMNSVFHELRGKFDSDDTYQGIEIHRELLTTIKGVTLKLMTGQSEQKITVEGSADSQSSKELIREEEGISSLSEASESEYESSDESGGPPHGESVNKIDSQSKPSEETNDDDDKADEKTNIKESAEKDIDQKEIDLVTTSSVKEGSLDSHINESVDKSAEETEGTKESPQNISKSDTEKTIYTEDKNDVPSDAHHKIMEDKSSEEGDSQTKSTNDQQNKDINEVNSVLERSEREDTGDKSNNVEKDTGLIKDGAADIERTESADGIQEINGAEKDDGVKETTQDLFKFDSEEIKEENTVETLQDNNQKEVHRKSADGIQEINGAEKDDGVKETTQDLFKSDSEEIKEKNTVETLQDNNQIEVHQIEGSGEIKDSNSNDQSSTDKEGKEADETRSKETDKPIENDDKGTDTKPKTDTKTMYSQTERSTKQHDEKDKKKETDKKSMSLFGGDTDDDDDDPLLGKSVLKVTPAKKVTPKPLVEDDDDVKLKEAPPLFPDDDDDLDWLKDDTT